VRLLVVDASIAIKWVVPEPGTPEAIALQDSFEIIAPELLIAECANILWKKVARGNLTREQSQMAAELLEELDVELFPMRKLFPRATELALELNHPAYDCFYVALAEAEDCPIVTADVRLATRLRANSVTGVDVLTLADAVTH
jgi:predicted nucleic acid-binding protein